ncbi:uncharacterized protein LOC135704549 [Ochlerotatus camptorhynchus]|uniref:uncharacterized protein LOC135704549 n=1 Tax=Ochlerotatus camptorhynchus TaxID=644619 RepID=UPI0031DA3CCC
MKLFIVLSVTISLALGAPAEESKNADSKKDKRGLVEIGHNFGFEEPLLVEPIHASHVTKHVTVTNNVPVLYPVEVEKHIPIVVEKKVPVYIEKQVHVPVERLVSYPVKVNVPVVHKEYVQVAKPYPVHVEKSYPVYVKDPIYYEQPAPVYVKNSYYQNKKPYYG